MSARVLVLLLSAIAIPATAQTFGLSIGAPDACLPVGNALYRLAPPGTTADYTVRLDAAAPDIRIHLTETPDEADFVLVDDGETVPACRGAAIRRVKLDAAAAAPDLTVALTAEGADFRLFVRSRAFTPPTAAALFAAAQIAHKPRVSVPIPKFAIGGLVHRSN